MSWMDTAFIVCVFVLWFVFARFFCPCCGSTCSTGSCGLPPEPPKEEKITLHDDGISDNLKMTTSGETK